MHLLIQVFATAVALYLTWHFATVTLRLTQDDAKWTGRDPAPLHMITAVVSAAFLAILMLAIWS